MEEKRGRLDDDPRSYPIYLFHRGENFQAHRFFGCHREERRGGFVFRLWAPHAKEVRVIGDFSDWKPEQSSKMEKISDETVFLKFTSAPEQV